MSPTKLLRWCTDHGCTVLPLSENKAKVVFIIRGSNRAFLSYPFYKDIKEPVVFGVCSRLAIPVPKL